MPAIDELAERITSIGFRCTGCSECCRRVADDSNLVIVSPPEIRAIMAATGMTWDETAEPYPEFIDGGDGARYTFAWCIRRRGNTCIFLVDGRCTIYAHRPWICRTYPFMLDGDALLVSECRGLGAPIPEEEARDMARALAERSRAEAVEEAGIRRRFAEAAVPKGRRAVFDSEGMKVLDG